MFRKICLCLLAVCVMIAFSATVFAGDKKKETKKGILLVCFGTSVPEAQAAFQNIEEKVKASFPNVPIRWAYTSHIIRQKLAKEGKQLDSVETAMAKMMDEGFTQVAVQSFHIIGGEEFDGMYKNVNLFSEMSEGIENITIGYPLLGTQEDMEKVSNAIIENIPKERKKYEAIVLMGHGTPHPGNAFYAALMFQLQQKDPNIFVGTVEGYPTIEEIKDMMLKKKIKKVYLMPFTAVAGDHARNDMAGDEPDSWKSILTKAEITCVPILKGSAEYDNIVAIWIDHLKKAFAQFK